ncbi:MAG: glycosyltransferase family 4 protein [Candidatus Competibacterales bacterium]
MWRRFWKALRGAAIAHIHTCSGLSFFLDSCLAVLAHQRGVAVVYHIHGARFDQFIQGLNPLALAWVRRTLGQGHAVVVVSEDWRERLDPLLPGAPWVVIPNGVPGILGEGNAAADALADPALKLLFIGNLMGRKGVVELIEAVAAVNAGREEAGNPHPLVSLAIAGGEGEPGYEATVVAAVAAAGDPPWIRRLGPVTGRDKVACFAAANGFALFSQAEGLPIALLEAMSAGHAVVTTAVGGVRTVVEDGVHGLLLAPGDTAGLPEALARLAEDPDLRRRLGDAAKARWQSQFSVEVMAEGVVALYARLLPQTPVTDLAISGERQP